MRAVVRTGLLGKTISFATDHPHPEAKDSDTALAPDELLIKVKAAAINPIDYKMPRAILGKVVGSDVSGVVEKVGADVKDFQIGDHVFGTASGAKSGSLADHAVVSTEKVAKKPEWLSFEEAASLGVAYLTGIQSLRAGNVKEGSSVLVIGASGGCGQAGVQLANAMGATRIVGICSGKKFDFVRDTSGVKEAGNLELVDYTDDDALKNFIEENVGKFDCVYDTASGSGHGEAYEMTMAKLVKEKSGKYVQINMSPSTFARRAIGRMPPQMQMILCNTKDRAGLEEIASLLQSSDVKPHLNLKSFDEKGVEEGFEQLKGRRTNGKIVFNID